MKLVSKLQAALSEAESSPPASTSPALTSALPGLNMLRFLRPLFWGCCGFFAAPFLGMLRIFCGLFFGDVADFLRPLFWGCCGFFAAPFFWDVADFLRPLFWDVADFLRPLFWDVADFLRPLFLGMLRIFCGPFFLGCCGFFAAPFFGDVADFLRPLFLMMLRIFCGPFFWGCCGFFAAPFFDDVADFLRPLFWDVADFFAAPFLGCCGFLGGFLHTASHFGQHAPGSLQQKFDAVGEPNLHELYSMHIHFFIEHALMRWPFQKMGRHNLGVRTCISHQLGDQKKKLCERSKKWKGCKNKKKKP